MKSILVTLCLIAGSASASDYVAEPAQSRLQFTASAQGEAFTGSFASFSARIVFDPGQPELARFDVRIELASADTGNSERDETLRGDDFFAVARAPQATWRATGATALGDGRYRADGKLTLRGVTQVVPLTFQWRATDGGAQLDGEASIDRLDFDVGAGEWRDTEVIAAPVAVRTHLRLQPSP